MLHESATQGQHQNECGMTDQSCSCNSKSIVQVDMQEIVLAIVLIQLLRNGDKI